MIRRLSALLALLSASAAANAATPAQFAGVWMPVGDGIAHPEGGGAVPLTAAAAKAVGDAAAATARGDLGFDPVMHCLPHGTPRAMMAPTPVQLLVTGNRILFLHQWNHSYRIVYLDRGHAPEVDPSFVGDSVGRWDGDTLSIDTTNFRAGLLDRSGMPVGEKLHVVERYRLARGGRRLIGRITVEDPDDFVHPWTFPVLLQRLPEGRVVEQVCADAAPAVRAHAR